MRQRRQYRDTQTQERTENTNEVNSDYDSESGEGYSDSDENVIDNILNGDNTEDSIPQRTPSRFPVCNVRKVAVKFTVNNTIIVGCRFNNIVRRYRGIDMALGNI